MISIISTFFMYYIIIFSSIINFIISKFIVFNLYLSWIYFTKNVEKLINTSICLITIRIILKWLTNIFSEKGAVCQTSLSTTGVHTWKAHRDNARAKTKAIYPTLYRNRSIECSIKLNIIRIIARDQAIYPSDTGVKLDHQCKFSG